MNERINVLVQKEISRKEFLGMSALAVGSIFGFGTIIKLLTGKSLSLPQNHGSLVGYGGGSYGGGKKAN